jgi:hypothetical protein
MPHQKLILPIPWSSGSGLEESDQFLRTIQPAAHDYPFDPMARLNV